jgi:hypothetical protein
LRQKHFNTSSTHEISLCDRQEYPSPTLLHETKTIAKKTTKTEILAVKQKSSAVGSTEAEVYDDQNINSIQREAILVGEITDGGTISEPCDSEKHATNNKNVVVNEETNDAIQLNENHNVHSGKMQHEKQLIKGKDDEPMRSNYDTTDLVVNLRNTTVTNENDWNGKEDWIHVDDSEPNKF